MVSADAFFLHQSQSHRGIDTGKIAESLLIIALIALLPLDILAQSAPAAGAAPQPKLSQFVLYAEQSVKLGTHSHAEHGDVGVRTASPPLKGVSQLTVGKEVECRDLFAPSIAIENDAVVHDLWTDSLDRNPDSKVSAVAKFPATAMPPLPLATASGTGRDIDVESGKEVSLTPGVYGAISLDHKSRLVLAGGSYTFGSVVMQDESKILADRGPHSGAGAVPLDLRIVGGLWMREHAEIAPRWDGAQAKDFTIEVAGSDPTTVVTGTRMMPTTVVSMGEQTRIHGLVAAPHGTVWLADEAGITGAVAAFAIVTGERVRFEFENGFADLPSGQRGTQLLHGYFAVEGPGLAPLVGPVPPDTNVALSIGLPVRDPQGLQDFLKAVSDPKSPSFRKFLTQAQFYAKHGAASADYQAVLNWAKSSGFTINATYPNNLLLSVTGTAAQIEQSLYVSLLYRRRRNGSTFVSVDRDPSLDLSVRLLHIDGLGDFLLPHHAVTLNGTGKGKSYRAVDLRYAYLGTGSSCQKLNGSGQVVGIVGWQNFKMDDIVGYDALQNQNPLQIPPLNPANVSIVAQQGGNPPAGSDEEAAIDVEMVQAMAPGATIRFFQGSSGITGHLDDILAAMATSTPPLTVATSSLGYGECDTSQQHLDEMAAQGVSFFNSSDDYGDIGDPKGNLDMNKQTLVGGTFLTTGPLIAPLPNPVYPPNYYAGEATWRRHPPNQQTGVTGGGVTDGNYRGSDDLDWPSQGCYCWPKSVCCNNSGVPIPDYQRGVSMATNGGSPKWRNYPDVAMLADDVEIYFQGANETPMQAPKIVGGTSVAAPLWAGFTALVNQQSLLTGGSTMGFLNPTIYDIGLTSGQATDLYKATFNDIADGVSNANGFGSGFTSVAGYDLTTGWGTPTCQLLNQLATPTPLTPNIPLSLIRFIIKTGDDDAGGGLHDSSQTADVLLQDGTSFTVPLRNNGDPHWDNLSTHQVDFPVPNNLNPPLTQLQGIAGVRINLVQNNPDFSADNWDIANLRVELFNPGSSPVCQINLIGTSHLQDGSTGLVRLSKSPGSHGVGPSATFNAGTGSPGCQ